MQNIIANTYEYVCTLMNYGSNIIANIFMLEDFLQTFFCDDARFEIRRQSWTNFHIVKREMF